MKMFRSCYFVLAAALSIACSAILMLVEPLTRYVAIGCEELTDGMSKLYRELTHKRNEDVLLASGVGSGLLRESNGFRQSTATSPAMAMEEWEGFTPAHG